MPDFRLRNIPESYWRKIKALAALAGQSVNDYLLQLLREHVDKKGQKL